MSLLDFPIEILPFFIVPIAFFVLSKTLEIIKEIARGNCTKDTARELMKANDKLIKEEKEKINVDEDLKKYFNYKE